GSHILFMYTRPPHTEPTLFPYTTLFRSGRDSCTSMAARNRHDGPPAGVRTRPQEPVGHPRDADGCRFRLQMDRYRRKNRQPSASDRKSTRLNSSHVSISYAVFCLKKKPE